MIYTYTGFFTQEKVIAASLQNGYPKEVLSSAPWSFLLFLASLLSLLLSYKKVKNSQKRC